MAWALRLFAGVAAPKPPKLTGGGFSGSGVFGRGGRLMRRHSGGSGSEIASTASHMR